MGFKIAKVERGGLADELGLRKGDELLEINGEKLIDLIDYQQLMSCEDLVLTVRDRTGEVYEVECDKDMDEELGADFEGDMLGSTRLCANKCLFCFVDQLPKDMRSSLYVKDDDWRMSLMMGNYVTMTNVGDRELDRIINRHASPLYISVHATDGPLRAKLLGQPRGANLMDQLNKLAAGGIQFHGQAVLCPGINDGPVLEKTVRDMAALYPACITLALVPVGLTGHRAGLCNLKLYDRETANKLLDEVEKWQKEFRRTLGTALGAAAGELLPAAVTDAMGIVLYGMFLAIILPPSRRDKHVLMVVGLAAGCSCLFRYGLTAVSEGFAVILSALAAAVAGALLFPVEDGGEVSA